MSLNVIPITNLPNQNVTITTEVDYVNRSFICELVYFDKLDYWAISIINYDTKEYYLTNIPLVRAADSVYRNILYPYGYLHIGSIYIVKVSEDSKLDMPDKLTFGTEFLFVWGDNYDTDITESS